MSDVENITTLTHEQVVSNVQAGFNCLMDIGLAAMEHDPAIGLALASWSAAWLGFMSRGVGLLTEEEAQEIVLSNLPEGVALPESNLVI